jgi:hypothetical protein
MNVAAEGSRYAEVVGAGLVPARLCPHAARRATTTRAFTPVFDGLWVPPTNTEFTRPLHFN